MSFGPEDWSRLQDVFAAGRDEDPATQERISRGYAGLNPGVLDMPFLDVQVGDELLVPPGYAIGPLNHPQARPTLMDPDAYFYSVARAETIDSLVARFPVSPEERTQFLYDLWALNGPDSAYKLQAGDLLVIPAWVFTD